MAKPTKEPELTPREAIAHFERAARANPRDAQARLNLGSAFYVAGDLDAAFHEFKEAAAISPSLDHAHYYLGVLYARRGDRATARQELEKVLNGSGHMLLKNQAKIQLQWLEGK